tara:strand:+ start:93 stop:1046 length:954 start_codon:yes stop_codon:yes gene_type:complete
MNLSSKQANRINKNIYNAQCIGNVEPIEFMIPYPSMRSLIEGQNIKYAEQIIIREPTITNLGFYKYIQQTANWLESLGVKPKQTVTIPQLDFPQSEILLYGVWQLGAVGVLQADVHKSQITDQLNKTIFIPSKTNLLKKIKSFPKNYTPKYKPNLSEKALITFETGIGIKLSHYNLLVNANSIQKTLNIESRKNIYCNLIPSTSAWVVFKAILPIYSGCIFSKKNPHINIGTENCDYTLRFDINNILNYSNNDIAICPENTAAISIGSNPIHLTDLYLYQDKIKIKGHSIMMGYLNDKLNESSFRDNSLYVLFNRGL